MPQPEPSVSDSISYLQSFLNNSGSVLHGNERGGASSPLPPCTPQRPPLSLPASFFHTGPTAQLPYSVAPTAPATAVPHRRSPPSTISVLSHRSSAQRSTLDDASPDSAYVSRPPLTGDNSLPLSGGRNYIDSARNGVDGSVHGGAKTFNLFTGSANRATPVFERSGMFRYGSVSARSSRDGWQSAVTPPSLFSAPVSKNKPGMAGLDRGDGWPRMRSSSWGQVLLKRHRHSVSSPTSHTGSSLLAEERFPWRHSAAAPSMHHGASLLWGWGNKSVSDANQSAPPAASAAACSPSPLQRPLYLSEDRQRGNATLHLSNSGEVDHDDAVPLALRADSTRRARVTAYEEVGEREAQSTAPVAASAHRRRPPVSPPSSTPSKTLLPVLPQYTVGQVELSVCHNPDEHAANMRRIAHYLKDYYAREADEMERGVESLTAEDVAGLAQCFYIDLYRTVRRARQSAGLETSSFGAEDPSDNIIASFEPPQPLQREEGRNDRQPKKISSAPPPVPPGEDAEGAGGSGALSDSDGAASSASAAAAAYEGCREARQRRLNCPMPPSQHSSSTPSTMQRKSPEKAGCVYGASPQLSNSVHTSVPSPGRPQQQEQGQHLLHSSRSLSHQRNLLLSSPENELLSSPAATTHLAPNEQLAFSGRGSHPVQVITARVPPFRNDDTVMTDSRSRTSSFQQQQQRTTPGHTSSNTSGVRSFQRAGSMLTYNQRDDAASLSALATTPSPPYRHLTPEPQQQLSASNQQINTASHPSWTASTATSPYTSTLRPTNPSRSSNLPGALKDSTNSPRRSRYHRTRSDGQYVQASECNRDDSIGSSRSYKHSNHSDGEAAWNDRPSCTTEGSDDHNDASSAGPRGSSRRPAPAEPSSGIVKRPLKDLMPLLRSQATLIVKQVRHDRRPHLRLFQILDCIDVYHGKEVLMPHFTWVAGEDVYRYDRRPRPRKTENGVPLPTGLSLSQLEVPYETALNLTHLEAVYVGAGKGISAEYMGLFHRRGSEGAIVDHRGRPVANGMCAVFVFTERPVAVTFLREEDRQLWVGAMMGVVERNRTLSG